MHRDVLKYMSYAGFRSLNAHNRDAKRRRVRQLTAVLGAGATVGAGALTIALADAAPPAAVANALSARGDSASAARPTAPSSLRHTKRAREDRTITKKAHPHKKVESAHPQDGAGTPRSSTGDRTATTAPATTAPATGTASTPKAKPTVAATKAPVATSTPPAAPSGGGSGTSSGGSHP